MAISGVTIRDKYGNVTVGGQPQMTQLQKQQAAASRDSTRESAQSINQETAMNTPNIGVFGKDPIRQSAYEQQLQTGLEAQHQSSLERLRAQQAAAARAATAKLAQDMFRERWGMANQMPGGSSGQDGNILANEQAARAAAFARAKEQSGNTALAALESIKNQFAGQGLTGSTMEAGATADVVRGAAGDVNDFTREQLLQDLSRAGRIADRNYAGDLTRRGQDTSYRQSLLGLLSAGLPTVY